MHLIRETVHVCSVAALQVLAELLHLVSQVLNLGVEHTVPLRLDDGINLLVDTLVQDRLALDRLDSRAELDGRVAKAGRRSDGLGEGGGRSVGLDGLRHGIGDPQLLRTVVAGEARLRVDGGADAHAIVFIGMAQRHVDEIDKAVSG